MLLPGHLGMELGLDGVWSRRNGAALGRLRMREEPQVDLSRSIRDIKFSPSACECVVHPPGPEARDFHMLHRSKEVSVLRGSCESGRARLRRNSSRGQHSCLCSSKAKFTSTRHIDKTHRQYTFRQSRRRQRRSPPELELRPASSPHFHPLNPACTPQTATLAA